MAVIDLDQSRGGTTMVDCGCAGRMFMSSRSRKTAELARERMRAETVERIAGEDMLDRVPPTPPVMRTAKPQPGTGRTRAPDGRPTERAG